VSTFVTNVRYNSQEIARLLKMSEFPAERGRRSGPRMTGPKRAVKLHPAAWDQTANKVHS
jgi:hypothetical protein